MNRDQINRELTFLTSRSGGKGGQHVNKTESKVELIFDLLNSFGLSLEEKQWLFQKWENKLHEGKLHLISQTDRSQIKNKEEVKEKFFVFLEKSLVKPKKRKKTKPSKAVKEKRLESKKRRSDIKASRRKSF
jgi:ribosome-associated protein